MEQPISKVREPHICRTLITALIMAGKTCTDIMAVCKDMGHQCVEVDVTESAKALRDVLPKTLTKLIDQTAPFRITEPIHVEWMKTLGVFEILDFMARKDIEDPPPYFKWIRDAIWICSNPPIHALVNALLFNGDTSTDVADVIQFKYRKQISTEALELYQKLFFNVDGVSAMHVIQLCNHMSNSSIVLRQMSDPEYAKRSGKPELDTGFTEAMIFHNSNYIKWKLGYKKIKPPSSTDFLEQVMLDASNKYYEATMMNEFAERSYLEGNSMVTGEAVEQTTTMYRNAEKERSKLMKSYTDLYIKASNSRPVGAGTKSKADELIEELSQLRMTFDDIAEHIIDINSMPDIAGEIAMDIKGMPTGITDEEQ
jgi:hypothetical protein